MKLSENEICKYSTTCPYNKIFICDLVSETGVFNESGFRSSLDETGKMKVIMEKQ
jgi:hypothetical protein